MNYATPVRTLIHLFVLLAVAAVITGAAQQQKQASLSNTPGTESHLASTVLARLISIDLQDESFENALKKIAAQAKLRVLFSRDIVPANKRITLAVNAAPLSRVLGEVLHDTQLDYLISEAGLLVLTQKERVEDETGTIVGRVLEVRTNKPLPGANVFVEGTSLGSLVDAEGNFKIERVPPGKYKLRASVVGYGKISKDITVRAGNQTSMDFFLDETTVGLDEVVVTGVAFETRRREMPADIAVMTSKQIAQKNASNITDLLKGEIAGVFAQTNGQFDYFSQIYLRGSGMSASGTEYAKIYIDGIEVSNPATLSTIDPSSVERIEVIRGPHAAALYGAEATAGVIQILTKKGANTDLNRPKVNASLSAGYIQSHFLGNEITPSRISPIQTNSTLEIAGGKQALSYRAGISYSTIGEWIQHYRSKTLGLSGGMRVTEGPISVELTTHWSKRGYDYPSDRYRYERWPGLSASTSAKLAADPNYVYPNLKYELNQTTIGLNVNYRPLQSWMHNVIIGQDNNGGSEWQVAPHYRTASDTLVYKTNYIYTRTSVRYNTSYRQSIGEKFSLRLTAGVEYSLYSTTFGNAYGIKLNNYDDIVPTSSTSRYFNSQDRWTAGYMGIIELGYLESLYATVSLSAKQDPRGYKKTYYTPPRFGLTYSQDLGKMQVRLRGQHGTAIKPVNPTYVTYSTNSTSSVKYLDNYDLVPENRSGWDAGIEAYWGNDLELSVTRFDEVGKEVIQLELLDVGPPSVYQWRNIGDVALKGWEVSSKFNFEFVGLKFLTLKANYGYSDNRVVKLSSMVPTPTTFQIEGDRVTYVPTHSGGGELLANFGPSNVALDWQFSGGGRFIDNVAWYDYRFGTAKHRDVGITYAEWGTSGNKTVTVDGITGNISRNSLTRSYIVRYPVYAKFGVRAEHELTTGVWVFLHANNLLNDTSADIMNTSVTRGRVTTLGVRIRY